MAYISWFNRVRQGATNKGVYISGVVHKLSPIRDGKSWKKGECPKCGSKNGFIFGSHTDGNVYVLFCQKCNKMTVRMTHKVKRDNVLVCNCGNPLPKGRKQFCYDCRPTNVSQSQEKPRIF